MPDISIIVPFQKYNKKLFKCIKSIINQSYISLELLLIQDCQTTIPPNKKILHHPNLTIIKNKGNGVSAARNTGILNSSGKYICFVDSDDWIPPNALMCMVSKIKKQNCELLVHGAKLLHPIKANYWMKQVVSPDTQIIQTPTLEKATETFGLIPFVWLYCIKKDFLISNSITFDETLTLGEDELFIMNCISHSRMIFITSERLYAYNNNRKGSVTHSSNLNPDYKLLENIKLVKKVQTLNGYNPSEKMLVWTINHIYYSLIKTEKDYSKPLNDVFSSELKHYSTFLNERRLKKYNYITSRM